MDLEARRLSAPLGQGDYGPVQFLTDSKTLVAGNRGERLLSAYSVAAQRLITHLPISVRPDRFCFSRDGGQLFVTGEGMDARGGGVPLFHAPDRRYGSGRPCSGSHGCIRRFAVRRQPAVRRREHPQHRHAQGDCVVPVGSDPGFIRVTPDDQYALVLNRKSGDMAILSVPAIAQNKNRYKTAGLRADDSGGFAAGERGCEGSIDAGASLILVLRVRSQGQQPDGPVPR